MSRTWWWIFAIGVFPVLAARGQEAELTAAGSDEDPGIFAAVAAPVDPACTVTEPVEVMQLFEVFGGRFSHVQVDEQHVYIIRSDFGNGLLFRYDKNSGEFDTRVATFGEGGPFDYTLSASHVFVMDWGEIPGDEPGAEPGPGSVTAWTKDLTASTVIHPVPTRCEINTLTDVEADAAGNLFFAQVNTPRASCPGETTFALQWVPPGSGNASPIALPPRPIDLLTLAGDHIFWADQQGIWRGAKTGGGGELIVPTTLPVRELQASAESIFWATSVDDLFGSPGQTFRFDFSTRANVQILPFRLLGMRFSDGFLYGGRYRTIVPGGNPAPVNIVRAKPNGHGLIVLAKAELKGTRQGRPSTVAVDDRFVYFFSPPTFDPVPKLHLLKICK